MGLKIFLLIIGLGCIASFFMIGGSMWENTRVGEGDIKEVTDVLRSDPLVFKDEYGSDTVSIRFFVVNDENPLVVPGKLLRTLDKRIFDLKEGDEITYWLRKKPSIIPMQNTVQNIFGLEDKDGSILTIRRAIEYYSRPDYFLVVALFVMLGAGMYVFLQLAKIW